MPCARATMAAFGPAPSYIGQLLTMIEPRPVAESELVTPNWFLFGPRGVWCVEQVEVAEVELVVLLRERGLNDFEIGHGVSLGLFG